MMSVLPLRPDRPKLRVAPWLSAAAGVLFLTAVAGGEDPAGLLEREFGLSKIPSADVWLLPAERRMQESLAALEPIHRAIISLQIGLDQAVQRNRTVWEVTRPRIEALRHSLSSYNSDDPQRRKIEQQIRELEAQAVPPEDLAGVPAVRKRLIELINHRLRLSLLLISLRQVHAELTADYERLAEEPAVRAALDALGPTHRLGPVQQTHRGALRRLDRYQQTVATGWQPIYRQSDRIRFGGIMNECLPAMFTWEDSSEPPLVTFSMWQACGLSLPEDAEALPLVLEGRRLTVRAAVLPGLRFGDLQLRDVPVLVLPPEGEDLGARIGPQPFTYAGRRVEIQPERLRLVIEP